MQLVVQPSFDRIPAEAWDALVGADHPFVEHAFLLGLERTGCVGGKTGWQPAPLLVVPDGVAVDPLPPDVELLGAAPVYLKADSMGEFIFDFAWADFHHRNGQRYYPKVVVAAPFTPATGPRLLLRPGPHADEAAALLAQGVLALATEVKASSVHWLYTPEEQANLLEQQGYFRRATIQALWLNPGYRDFEAFLATRKARIRKQIRRERREIANSGLDVRVWTGPEMQDAEWQAIEHFYRENIDRHGNEAYLNPAFFQWIRQHLAHRVVCTLARGPHGYVAGTLNFQKGGTLYGRYWGCVEPRPFLHFELAFYRLMEHCIAHGIERFEAGAGGEHKLQRGMEASVVHSAHWIAHPDLAPSIEQHVQRERVRVADELAALERTSTRRHD